MATRDEVYAQLQDVIADFFEIEKEEITLDAHLYEDLDLDSIDAIDLVVKVQNMVGKKVEAEDFKNARTVSEVVDIVVKLINE